MPGLYTGATGLWGGFAGLLYGSSALSTPPGLLADVGGFTPGFTPASLFAEGEKGVWFDPSDLSSMFQDVAGTIPVTATGQAVALIRDKSRTNTGSAQGSELIVNGGFATDTDWTKGGGWTIGSGVATRVSQASVTYLSQAITLTAGKSYVITFDVTALTSGGFLPRITGGTNVFGTTVTAVGSYSQVLVAVTGNTTLQIAPSTAGTEGSVDNVSVREILTTDAFQPLSTARPLLQNDGSNYYLDFDGVDDIMFTGTIDFSTSSINKISVFSGFRKMSDAVNGMLMELSRTATSLSGSFFLTAPVAPGVPTCSFRAGGTIRPTVNLTLGAAPVSCVFTGVVDIAGDLITIRENGAQTGQDTSNQGTGSFGAWPLFIGGRGSQTNFYYLGRLYSAIVLGRTATGTEITDTEAWVNGKTGAY